MYFKNSNLLFLHPGKCAGTSVEHWLLKELDEPLLPKEFGELMILNKLEAPTHLQGIKKALMYGLYGERGSKFPTIYLQHADIAAAKTLLGDDIFQSARKVAIVRNPYHRVLSAYYYNGWAKQMEFEPFVLGTLRDRISKNDPFTTNHFGLATKYTHVGRDCVVDLVMRKESMLESMRALASLLDTDLLEMPETRHQRSGASAKFGGDYMNAYTPETKRVVAELYEADFNLLGYEQ